MSAFLTSPDALNGLASYWVRRAGAPGSYSTPWGQLDHALRCSNRARGASEDPTKQDHAAAEIIASAEDPLTACFQILLEANQASLAARYPGDEDYRAAGPEYRAHLLPIVTAWIQDKQTGHLVGMASGYSYQSCEHDGWETCVAHELIRQVQNWLLKDLEARDCEQDTAWADWEAMAVTC